MPSPSGSLTTLRPDLASLFHEFEIESAERGFIAQQVLPLIDVQSQAGTFGRIPVEQLLQKRSLLRAPKSGYSRSEWTFKDASYSTREYGVEEPIDDREAAMYRNYFDAEIESAQIAMGVLTLESERRVADAIFNTSTFDNTAASTAWDTHASATPIADVNAAIQSVWDACGLWANALILTVQAFRELRQCAEIVERIESSGAGESTVAGKVTARQLAEVFAVDRVIVAGATGNSANEGQDVSFEPVWDKSMAMVARIATTDSFREPCLGRTFNWTRDGADARDNRASGGFGGTVETYRSEEVRGDVVRVRHDVDEVILYPQAGHLITGILS